MVTQRAEAMRKDTEGPEVKNEWTKKETSEGESKDRCRYGRKRRKRMSERRGGLLTSTGSLIGLCLLKRSVMIVRENDREILTEKTIKKHRD